MKYLRPSAPLLAALALVLVISGCGSSSDPSGDAVAVKISDAGCEPANLDLTAGAKNFEIETTGSGKVTEYEVLDGTRILAERENLTPGVTGKFSVNLPAGEYTSYCPNGTSSEYGKITVTGDGGSTSIAGASTNVKQASAGYSKYVESQTNELVKRTAAFTAAIKAGDTAQAKKLFATTREPYEAIEPVAESFGDLDPRIDARENDVAEGDKWTGFHRIEKTLWQDNTTKGLSSYADQLTDDVKELQTKAKGLTYQPAEIANGSTGLLDEVSKSKITGEEDRYSHTDLYDFAANVDGSQTAFKLLAPAVAENDPDLVSQINARYDDVDKALLKYRTTNGNGFVLYTDLTPADTKALSQKIDALAEPLSKVASQVVSTNK
ncbi:MAG: iron uptake system protein EfeO [Solirubrobacterales bacterium]